VPGRDIARILTVEGLKSTRSARPEWPPEARKANGYVGFFGERTPIRLLPHLGTRRLLPLAKKYGGAMYALPAGYRAEPQTSKGFLIFQVLKMAFSYYIILYKG